MFNSLFGNLTDWIAQLLDFIITWILEMMTFNLSFFTTNFPVIGTLYNILQGVGVGLVIGIAVFQLIKYFVAPLSDVRTNPIEIGIRAAVALSLVWFGNYFLEGVVNIFTYPYEALIGVDASGEISIMTVASSTLAGLITGGAGTVFALIMLIVVGWNTIKLILEIVERYLMVGVLTYTSPLIWSTITSKNTQDIFSKWISMFLGQCLLMLLNVWSLKMLVSILANPDANVFFKFILALAFCKVAQRFDTYLQSLGINAAHTGGSMVDDLMAVGSTLTGLTSKVTGNAISGAGNKALGETITKNGFLGGAAYGIGKAFGGASGVANGQGQSGLGGFGSNSQGQESGIFKTQDGKFAWNDKTGNEWIADSKEQMHGVQSAVRAGYPQYEGESGIVQNGNKFSWTDKDGNVHTADSLSDMLQQQESVRSAYTFPNSSSNNLGTESPVTTNSDGSLEWTDAKGNTYTADNAASMQEQQIIARADYSDRIGQETGIEKKGDGSFQWTDKDGNVYTASSAMDMESTRNAVRAGYAMSARNGNSVSSLQNRDLSSISTLMFNPNGTPKHGVTTFDSNGREVLSGTTGSAGNIEMAHKIANISSPTAMATGAGADSISAIKANTIASRGPETAGALLSSNINGGMVDERVNAATFETLFGDGQSEPIENGIDSVIPGLSAAVSSSNGELIDGAGDVTDFYMNDGEMTGTYTPVDAGGNELETQSFSIRNEDSYNSLSPEEQSGYTKFDGVDGSSYYAKSSQPEMDSVTVNSTSAEITGIENIPSHSSEVGNSYSAPTYQSSSGVNYVNKKSTNSNVENIPVSHSSGQVIIEKTPIHNQVNNPSGLNGMNEPQLENNAHSPHRARRSRRKK